jgi:hypothetical protein
LSSYKSITGTVLPVSGTGVACRVSHCSADCLQISEKTPADAFAMIRSIPVPIIELHLKVQTNYYIGILKRNISFFWHFLSQPTVPQYIRYTTLTLISGDAEFEFQ